jgi:hypothetical protein
VDAIATKYWSDARMVSASGTVVIYDLAAEPSDRWRTAAHHEWPIVVENQERSWTLFDPSKHWVNLTTAAPATSPAKGTIAVTGAAWIGHHLDPEIPGGICCVSLGLWSNEHTDPVMEITWYDAKGNLLSRANGAGSGKSDFEAWLYSAVPANAKCGWVYLREWKQRPIHLKRAAVTFWKPSTASAAARRDKPDDETKGVR